MKLFFKKIFYFNLVLITFCSFQSCLDPGIEHNKIIINSSNLDIILRIENIDYDESFYLPDTIIQIDNQSKTIYEFQIPSNSDKTIYFWSAMGTVSAIDDCIIYCEKAEFDTSNLIVNKDFLDFNNWTKVTEKESKNGDGIVNCYFEIDNIDIELN